MKNPSKTNPELIEEISFLTQKIHGLEHLDSERKRIEEETIILAEIGRVIGSTLDIEEVYERFAAEVRKLIPFDRLTINLNNHDQNTITVAYAIGPTIPGRRPGDSFPLKGSVNETLERTRSGMLLHPTNVDELTGQYPHLISTFQKGIRSFMSVPLVSRNAVIGVLHFRSKKPDVYKERDLHLAERIGAQIAGAIANAQLFADLKKAEEAQRRNRRNAERLAEEMAVIAEIGRVIGSTLDIEEVYEKFVAEARKLIPFDSLMINLIYEQENALEIAYVSGMDIPMRRQGDRIPFQRSFCESIAHERKGMILQLENFQEVIAKFPYFTHVLQAGLRSMMATPLISRDKVIGAMVFRSKEKNLYTEGLLNVADRIGTQITSAIANAQLYAGLRKAEQELKESEQRYRELSIIDDLTQLYNSRHFYFQLKIELDRSNRYEQPLTLLLFDLDNFKHFNDAYGHVEGDQVLRRLGEVVKRCLRETDFAYRYGGEEFTILLPMTTSAEGAVTAERIRTEFKKETFSPAPGQDVHVTVSIGIAQCKPQEEMKAFVHRVDQLMYQGKKSGKDRVCCDPFFPEQFKGQSSIQFDFERH